MLDELDVGWDADRPRRGGPSSRQARERRQQRRRRQRRRRTGSTFFKIFFTIFLVLLGYGVYQGVGWAQETFGPKDYGSGDRTSTTVQVRVKPGDDGFTIAKSMVDAGVVRTSAGFVTAFNKLGGQKVQPGTWLLFKKMTAADTVSALLNRDKCAASAPKAPCRVVNTVTIPEGFITLEIYTKLSKVTGVSVDDFKAAAADPLALGVPASWFDRAGGAPSKKSVEGFLFPATYDFDGGMSATEILTAMVKKFLAVADQLKFVATVKSALKGKVTAYEALIAASIAQAEGKTAADQGKVARVLYNRIYGSFQCNCLQLDSAINYWYKIQGDPSKDPNDFKQSEIHNPDNPYNTHDKSGWPITPLGNPGESALKGAMNPPTGKWVYFVTVDTKGTTLFSETYPEFQANVRTACRNGVLTGSACP